MEYKFKVQSPEWYAICESMNIENNKIPEAKSISMDNRIFTYDIQFIVGGVELNFTKVLDRLYTKHEHYVESEAKAIVADRFNKLFDEVDKLKNKVESLTYITDEDWD